MFDLAEFSINGVGLIALIFGLVEFLKNAFNLEGKAVTMLSASVGAIVMIVYQLLEIIPQPYGQVVNIVVVSLAAGLSASGYYKFASSRLQKTE